MRFTAWIAICGGLAMGLVSGCIDTRSGAATGSAMHPGSGAGERQGVDFGPHEIKISNEVLKESTPVEIPVVETANVKREIVFAADHGPYRMELRPWLVSVKSGSITIRGTNGYIRILPNQAMAVWTEGLKTEIVMRPVISSDHDWPELTIHLGATPHQGQARYDLSVNWLGCSPSLREIVGTTDQPKIDYLDLCPKLASKRDGKRHTVTLVIETSPDFVGKIGKWDLWGIQD